MTEREQTKPMPALVRYKRRGTHHHTYDAIDCLLCERSVCLLTPSNNNAARKEEHNNCIKLVDCNTTEINITKHNSVVEERNKERHNNIRCHVVD